MSDGVYKLLIDDVHQLTKLRCDLQDITDRVMMSQGIRLCPYKECQHKNVEASNSAVEKPVEGAQPPKREHNNARDEICAAIISNCICDYCVHRPGMASDYCVDCTGGSDFVGRKLRPC